MPIFVKEGQAIFFAHIPKTGGRTIESTFLAAGYQLSYIDMEAAGLNRFRRCPPQHMDASQYTRILELAAFDFMFAVVREPLPRLKSELAMRLHNRFERRIEQNDEWVLDGFRRYAENSYLYENHLRPQSEFIVPGMEVFRFEDGLERIFLAIAARHPGVTFTPGAVRIGSREEMSGFSSAEVQFSDAVVARIKEFYSADYQRFYPQLIQAPP